MNSAEVHFACGLCSVYHHLHKLKLTGLRFFTVYGPLGRPDMAYFGFTQVRLTHRLGSCLW